jgi:hypothetical protein
MNMATGIYSLSFSGAGMTIQRSVSRTADNAVGWAVEVANAKAVTSWVKTDDVDGATCNLPAEHGYANGVFDVYWTGGKRIGCTGTILTNALTFATDEGAGENGSGDAYPASANTTVTVCRHQQINTAIDGDRCEIFAIELGSQDNSTARGQIIFTDADDAAIGSGLALVANEPQVYDVAAASSPANPLTGDPITKSFVTTSSATETVTLTLIVIQDSTP